MASSFLKQPVFAWVLAIVLMIAGWFGTQTLPVSQYPEIAPTTVRISATYTGATAQTVANSVTTVIEDGLTGIDGLLYMTSNSAQGSSQITLTFASGTDPDIAQVQVQNKLQLVESSLPDAVIQQGLTVTKSGDSILLVGALISKDGSYSNVALGDLFSEQMESAIEPVDGVGSINVFGAQYAMRIWLDPKKLYAYGLTAANVTSAISDQNTNVTAGTLGSLPQVDGQQITITMGAQAQLTSVDDFRKIVLKTEDGSSVFLGDVATVELGSDDYSMQGTYDGVNASGFSVSLASGANAIKTAALVHAEVDKLFAALPARMDVVYP